MMDYLPESRWQKLFDLEIGKTKKISDSVTAVRCSPQSLGAVFKHTKNPDEPYAQFRCSGCSGFDTFNSSNRLYAEAFIRQHRVCGSMSRKFSYDQPPPAPESKDKPALWDLVVADTEHHRSSIGHLIIADMKERDQVGRARYGTPLQPHNGRDALADAYAEALDLVVYLRQFIYEEIDHSILAGSYADALRLVQRLRSALYQRDGR